MLLPDHLVDEFLGDLNLGRDLLRNIQGKNLFLALMTRFYVFHARIYLMKRYTVI